MTLGACGVRSGDTVHCVVSDAAADAGDRRADRAEQHALPVPPRYEGFDRLREAGFTDDDISNYRHSFHGRAAAASMDEETMRQLEEDWMSSTAMAPSGRDFGTADGTNTDFVWGMLLGFVAGFVVMFFVGDSILNKQQTMGILSGIAANLLFSMMRPIA
eukprot:Unigene17022_Nuclearia_a/m.50093 Unigene17022_Nuclearia_a/g.50093  ORF Unigene17022_Nuclearia_a/g.50093 Unigene17022_Nuclearia_a/m.50093 type:complete len:160 (+) Unigene17022_Nuclearia_a:116-595(+)